MRRVKKEAKIAQDKLSAEFKIQKRNAKKENKKIKAKLVASFMAKIQAAMKERKAREVQAKQAVTAISEKE